MGDDSALRKTLLPMQDFKLICYFRFFRWSFVLESQASEEIVEEVDGDRGYGRVK